MPRHGTKANPHNLPRLRVKKMLANMKTNRKRKKR